MAWIQAHWIALALLAGGGLLIGALTRRDRAEPFEEEEEEWC